jgi:hypothetical protein
MTGIDTSLAPRGVLAAQRLVMAAAEHGDLAERHYLELKSILDLSTKKDKEKIAKFILGAANRMPETAAAAFEGYAAMVIGVGGGSIMGIPPIEMMEIAKVVQQYVGAAGPRWDIVWVPIHNATNQVLVVLVDPPMPGQGPFPCRSSGDSLTNGRIYIRADGETREANADEVDLLIQRGSAASKVEVDFAVEVLGEISPISHDDERTIDEYLSRQTARLLGALPTPQPPTTVDDDYPGSSGRTALMGLNGISSIVSAMLIPEERTEETYRASIDAWEDRFRAAWSSARARVAASLLTPIIVKVTNRTTVFFHDVEMKLHLEGEVFATAFVDPEWADDFSNLELPRHPRIWGPTQRTLGVPDYSHLAYMHPSTPGQYFPPSVSFKNGGSVDLDLDIGELRPLGSYESEDEEFVLFVADASLTAIRGTWQLTARDHNEVFKGEISIPVASPVDVTSAARRVLLLQDEEE